VQLKIWRISSWRQTLRLGCGLIFSSFILCEVGIAGEKGGSRVTSPMALSLQTNHLQLTPKGTIRVLTAFEWRRGWQAPVTQARGYLYRLGVLRFDLAIADNVSLQVRGAIRQVFRLRENSNASGVSSTTTATDVGDFSVATVACLKSAGKFWPALGFRIETKLPNTNQDRGIGTNTTDVTMSILATRQYGPALIFADIGIGILTAPRQINDQNDVLVYGLGMMWNISKAFHLVGEINGFASPRQHIPIGTEDRAAVRLGLVWRLSQLSLEVLATHGLAKREGKLGIMAGASWQFNVLGKRPKRTSHD
jgi:hypothetical protein